MKVAAWVVLSIVFAIMFGLLLYLLVGAVLFKFVFSRRSVASRVLTKNVEERLKQFNVDLGWWQKVKFKKVTTQSFDNTILCGHFFEANSNKTAIILHGFGGSYQEMQPFAKLFHDKNFNVLAVDLRAHGESGGNCIGYGWLDRLDVLAWVKFVSQKMPESKILLFGLSMGAAAVCMAAGEKDLTNVAAIISDCAFANAEQEISHIMKTKRVPKLFKVHVLSYVKRLYSFDVKQADAIKQIKKSKVPILLIHGQDDVFVPVENINKLYNAAPTSMCEKFIVEGATHANSYAVAGVLYEKRISDFLEKRTTLIR